MNDRHMIVLLATVLLFAAIFAIIPEETDCDEYEVGEEIVVDHLVYEIDGPYLTLLRPESEDLIIHNLTIPENIFYNGEYYVVREIAPGAFYGQSGEFCNILRGDLCLAPRCSTIGENAFKDNKFLTSVYCPEGFFVTIGNYAFSGADHIKNVYFESGARLNEGCFSYDTGLVTCDIISNNNPIGESSFYGCTALRSVNVSSIFIGKSAFYGCASLISYEGYTSTVDQYAFYGCTSLISFESDITVTINQSAFEGCTALESVKSGSDFDVAANAFKDCKRLNSIDRVKSAAVGSFQNCKALTIIDFSSENFSKVPNKCFAGCTGLRTVKITAAKQLEAEAFSGCAALESVEFPAAGYVRDNVFVNCVNLSEVIMPNVTELGSYAFKNCTKLEKVIMDDLTNIRSSAFEGCSGLVTVSFKELSFMGESAFARCYKLSDFPFEDCTKLTSIGSHSFEESGLTACSFKHLTEIGDYAFYGCEKLVSVHYLENLEKIGSSAFENCTALTAFGEDSENSENMIFHDGIVMGEKAFFNCGDLKWHTIMFSGNGGHTLGDNCFDIGNSLTIYVLCNHIESDETVECDHNLKNSRGGTLFNYIGEIPETDLTFEFCTASNVIRISGECVFDVPPERAPWRLDVDSLFTLSVVDGVTGIGEGVFANMALKGLLYLPNSVETIGANAFENCKFTLVIFESNLTSVGEKAFLNCSSISGHVVLENANIGESAFEGCTGITGLTINGTDVDIGRKAFYGCSNIHNITFGADVDRIGESAFEGCTGLNSHVVVFEGTPSTLENNSLSFGTSGKNVGVMFIISLNTDISIFRPEVYGDYTDIAFNMGKCGENCSYVYSLLDCGLTIRGAGEMYDYTDYNGDNPAPWLGFNLLIQTVNISNAITKIGDYSFYQCEEIINVVFPFFNGGIEIGAHAFDSCRKMKGFNAPSMTNVGDYAFANCESLTGTIDLFGVETVGNYAFYGCANITGVNLRETEIIGNSAFQECGLEGDLIIPKNIVGIGEYAFYGCSGLDGGRIIFEGDAVQLGAYAFALGNVKKPEIYITVESNGWATKETIPKNVFGYFTVVEFKIPHVEEEPTNYSLYAVAAVIVIVFIATIIILHKMDIISFERKKKLTGKNKAGGK